MDVSHNQSGSKNLNSPSTNIRVAQGGANNSKHEKKHGKLETSIAASRWRTLFFFRTYYFASCLPKTTEFESPWDLRQGFLFTNNSTNWREYGLKYGSGRSLCSSLHAIIVCGVWDFGIDHGKRFFSSLSHAQVFFWNCLYKHTNEIREIFIILSKMADFGRSSEFFSSCIEA